MTFHLLARSRSYRPAPARAAKEALEAANFACTRAYCGKSRPDWGLSCVEFLRHEFVYSLPLGRLRL